MFLNGHDHDFGQMFFLFLLFSIALNDLFLMLTCQKLSFKRTNYHTTVIT